MGLDWTRLGLSDLVWLSGVLSWAHWGLSYCTGDPGKKEGAICRVLSYV